MAEMKYCEGCGATIQHEDPKKAGYIPSSASSRNRFICQRCFRIKHYNEVQPVQMNEDDFLQILNGIATTESLVVQIVDLFDIDGTLISGLPRFIGKNPFIMLANKIDLFPKSINPNKLMNWLSAYFKNHGLHPEKIFLISAEKNIGLEEVAHYIENRRNNRNVHVVGATNVGKSSFINRLISFLNRDSNINLTTSNYPGTTLNTVYIPLSDGNYIIDTPGVVHKNRYSEWVIPDTLKIISPKKQIKPKVYQLYEEQTLFIGGLARIDQIKEANCSFVCYLSNAINIHRTKLEKAEEIYEKHLGELLSPPTYEELNILPPFTKHSFKISKGSKKDIVISGLGWISVEGDTTNIDIYAPKGIGVSLRDALI